MAGGMEFIKEMVMGIGPAEKAIAQWLMELATADKRDKRWKTDAKECVRIYESEDYKEADFNILYSNTETLLPALYSNSPRPTVKRRYDDADPIGKAAALVMKRSLEYEMDSGLNDDYSFSDSMEGVVLDALVPGRGVVRFKIKDKEGKGYVCREAVPWERFKHGYGRTWAQVQWISFDHYLSDEQIKKDFPDFKDVDKLDFNEAIVSSSKDSDESGMADSERQKIGKVKVALIVEIWDKRNKQVLFIAPSWKYDFLKKEDDPYGIPQFFPTPQPLMFYKKVSGLVPATVYSSYKNQAEELNRVSARIIAIVDMMRVRGFYDSTMQGLSELMSLKDGDFQPLDGVAGLGNGQGKIPDAFWFMPIQELVAVLQQLYASREAIKKVIYEVNGIADILRGSSVASETATAQGIKDKWGTLRLKRWQKMVAVYARDSLRIMAQLTAQQLTAEEFKAMTMVQLPTDEEKGQAGQQLQQIQMKMQQSQQPPMPGMPPAPPAPPPPPQLLEGLKKVTEMPSWQDIEKLFKDDLATSYHIDIETNSTLDIEASEDQKMIADFLNAMAQFLNGVGPLVEKGAMKPEAANAIMLTIARRFRFGEEVEEYLKVEGGAGMQEKMEQAEKAAQEAQGQVKGLESQLNDAKLKDATQQIRHDADKKIQTVVAKAGETVLMTKIELVLLQHQTKMQQAIDAVGQQEDKDDLSLISALHQELLEKLSSLIPEAAPMTQAEPEPMPMQEPEPAPQMQQEIPFQ